MENETEKIIIELLQEIKQGQEKLNQRFDEMDKRFEKLDVSFNFIAGELGKLSINTSVLTMKELEPVKQKLEENIHMLDEIKNPINEPVSFENLEELWNKALSHIAKEISKPSFETWMKSTKLLSYNNSSSTVTITAPNSFARDWLENHYSNLIKDVLEQLTKKELIVEFVVQKDQE